MENKRIRLSDMVPESPSIEGQDRLQSSSVEESPELIRKEVLALLESEMELVKNDLEYLKTRMSSLEAEMVMWDTHVEAAEKWENTKPENRNEQQTPKFTLAFALSRIECLVDAITSVATQIARMNTLIMNLTSQIVS